MYLRHLARRRLFVFGLALTGFMFPLSSAKAEPTNYLINGQFSPDDGGWQGVFGGNDCSGAEPSMGPWGTDGLVFTYEYNLVYQEVLIPVPGDVTLNFTGQLGQAGGHYEAFLEDNNESVSSGELVNVNPEQASLTITTEEPDELVIVTFGGIDEAWWSGCYGPIITDASLNAESVPTTTTTTPPNEYVLPSNGLDYWSYDSSGGQPNLPPSGELLSNGHIDGLNYDWGGGEILDSGKYDGITLEFQGWLSPPEAKTYYICAFTDDGFKLYLDQQLVINDWWDRGPSCGNTADVDFSDGQPKQLTAYFYENGGGAVAMLRYYADNGSWLTVPDSWYSDAGTSEPPQTTTTTPSYFLGAPTNVQVTQTDDGIVVSWTPSSEDVGIGPERYAVSWSKDGSGWGIPTGNVGDENALDTEKLLSIQAFESTGGLDAEYIFTVRADNDTYGVYSAQSDGASFTVAAPVPTTTTEAPQTTTTTSPPVTTEPPTTIDDSNSGDNNGEQDGTTDNTGDVPLDDGEPESPTPEVEVPESTPGSETEETPSEEPITPEPSPEDDQPVDEDPVADDPGPVEPPADETPADPLSEEALQDMAPEEVVAVVEAAIEEGLSDEEAVALATNAAVIAVLDKDQAEEVFKSIDVGSLSDAEIAEVVSAVQDAPEEVREAFEQEINIFGSGGAMDGYTPIGSTITVGERRVVIAATGVLLAGVPMPTRGPAPSPQPVSGSSSMEPQSDNSDRSRKYKKGR